MNRIKTARYRFIIVFVLLISLFVYAGCSTNGGRPGEALPDDNRLMVATGGSAVYHNGILYYLGLSSGQAFAKVYYADLTEGESGALCGKPECTHDSADCNACVESEGYGLIVYENKLYWLSSWGENRFLLSEELDGTGQTKVMELDRELEGLTFDSSFVGIYDGKLFRCGCGSSVSGGSPVKSMLLYSQPLKSGSKPDRLFYKEDILRVFSRMDGNKLYFAAIGSQFELTLYDLDMDSGEVTELYSDNSREYDGQDLIVSGDKLILYGTGPAVYVYSLTDCSLNEIRNEGREYLFATDTKLYEMVSRTQYRLYDYNGTLLSQGAIDPPGFEGKEYYTRYLGCAGEKMIFVFTAYAQSGLFSLIDSSDQNSIVTFDTETLQWTVILEY